jgi:hypothetical protein
MLKKDDKIEEVIKEEVVAPKADDSQGIEINEPMDLRPTELPLVIKLPADASKAQIAYAKTLNGYAYKNPQKWAEKKDDKMGANGVVIKGLISKLKDLKNAPDPVEGNLKINKSAI